MSLFIIRVELHSNNYVADFTRLHDLMQVNGFSKTIKSDNGVEYHLPRAEYLIYSATDNYSSILKKVESVVKLTGKTAEILVTESKSSTWSNLTPVK